jgi:hypothetical protein
MNRCLVFALALLAFPVSAHAVEFFKATLGPNGDNGSAASGSASFILDEEAAELRFEITIEGLGSPEIGAHIHAPDGSILFQLPLGPVKSGVWQGVGLAQIFQLRGEQLYVLVHTENIPAGEARGNIVAGKVPVEEPSMGRLKARFSSD